jgi:voltage-gated potassium channel Kch
MRKVSLRQRLQYHFDGYMAAGTKAMLIALAVVSALIVIVSSAVVVLTRTAPNGEGFSRMLWVTFLHEMDSGAVGGDAGHWFYIATMFVVGISGLFILSALIGILNTGLDSRLQELRKGRSLVLETDHTVILGWNEQVFTIVRELVVANESRKSGAAIVILAPQDKVEMEDAIRERVPDTKNTRIVCRSGSPIDPADVATANPDDARSVIILAADEDPDSRVIKAALALTKNGAGPADIVTQVSDKRTADLIRMVSGGRVHSLVSADVIARVTAQTSRQSGLSVVYTELMNFEGDELYFAPARALAGSTYGDTLNACEDCTVVGLRRNDGTIALNPPMDTRIDANTQMIVIAADEISELRPAASMPKPDEAAIVAERLCQDKIAEKALLLGWNNSGPLILRELDGYVGENSVATIVCDPEMDIACQAADFVAQDLEVVRGDIRDRSLLESINPSQYDHVVVLAYEHLPVQQADAITLVTLLHLRDIAEHDETPFSIVSEMLDLRNRELAEGTRCDDFVVSDHILSLLIAQLSENGELSGVFKELLDSDGCEIHLKPVTCYVTPGIPVDFCTVVEAARRRGESALGYRVETEARECASPYGIHTNPRKSEKVTFSAHDKIIVLAE